MIGKIFLFLLGVFLCVPYRAFTQEMTTQRAINTGVYLFHIIGTNEERCKNEINSLIPLFGRSNAKLTISIYPASKYYDQWMKTAEYPQNQYYANYDSKGNLISWKEKGSEITHYLRWSNEGYLYGLIVYNESTGQRVGGNDYFTYASIFQDYHKKYNASEGWKLFLKDGHKYQGGVWNAEAWWSASFCGYKISEKWSEYRFTNTGCRIYMSKMTNKWGLSWRTNVDNPAMLKVLDIPHDLLPITDCNRLGLPKWEGMNNQDIYSLKQIIRNSTLYEYTWSW